MCQSSLRCENSRGPQGTLLALNLNLLARPTAVFRLSKQGRETNVDMLRMDSGREDLGRGQIYHALLSR